MKKHLLLSALLLLISGILYSQDAFVIRVSAYPETGGQAYIGEPNITVDTINAGEQCTVRAVPELGYNFVNWTENDTIVSSSDTYSFTVEGDRTFVANFEEETYTITTEVVPEGSGTVTGGGSDFHYGDETSLEASANPGYTFSQWQDGNTMNPRTITVSGNATYTATFTQDTYTITTEVTPEGSGTVTGGGSDFHYGDETSLEASANPGYTFSQWQDGNTANPRTITVSGNATYTATFTQNTYTITTEVTPEGSGTVTGGGNNFHYGDPATLTATANPGYTFSQWQDGNAENPRNITVTGDATYTATFTQNEYTITTQVTPSGSGSVTGGGNNFHYGDQTVLTATANQGYTFSQWQDGNTQNPRTITVTGNAAYTANFQPIQYTITTSVNPENSGTVTGGGTYNYNTTIHLVANANPGYTFSRWQDNNTQNPRTITVTGNAAYTATFTQDNYLITTEVTPEGSGTVTGGGAYHYGDHTTLTATANSDYVFQGWQDGNTENPRTITVTGDATYTAVFGEEGVTYYNVTAEVNPAGAGSVTGAGPFPAGSTTYLRANPNPGYTFQRWQDGITQNPRTVTVNGNLSFTAFFTQNDYTITAVATPAGSGMVTGGGNYHYGDQVTLSAIAYSGFTFDHWNDGITQNPRTITVTANATYTAFFNQDQPTEYTITTKVIPEGSGTVTGGGTYPAGAEVSLEASSYPHYVFDHWDDGTTANPRDIVVVGNATYTAHFNLQQYTITTDVIPEASGSVTGGGTYYYNDTATLTAVANEGYTFDHWDDDNTENPRHITVTDNATYTATFKPNQYTITVVANPEEGGTVAGGGTFDYGETCRVYASPNNGFVFINWTEGDEQCSGSAEYSFVVTGDRVLVANFADENACIIYVDIEPEEAGTTTGAGPYNPGDECTLRAFAKPGYRFVNWTKNDEEMSTESNYTFTVTGSERYVAHFEKKKFVITVAANPEEGGVLTGGGNYYYGTLCTLTATANPGYTFNNWVDAENTIVGTESTYKFVVREDASYTANFTQIQQYRITASANPPEGGSVSGGGNYNYGVTCTLTATPNPGYTFTNWMDSNNTIITTEPTYSFQVTTDASYTATFTRIQQYIVTTSVTPAGAGVVTGGGTYHYGEQAVLNATANEGFTFEHWDDGSVENPRTIIVTNDMEFVAVFRDDSCIEDLHNIEPKSSSDGIVYILVYPNPADTYKYQWYRDGNAIPDAQKQYYYEQGGLANGDYMVYVSKPKDGDCGAFSPVITVNNRRSVSSFIYPNPAHSDENLFVVCDGPAQLFLYSVDGRLLFNQTLTDSPTAISVHLPKGVYVVHLFGENGFASVEKLVIQ